MITTVYEAVGSSLLAVFWAVFFSASATASDSSLTNLEAGMGELAYNMSRSIVTVEASSRVNPNEAGVRGGDAVRRLISSGVIFDTLGHVLVAAPMVVEQERIVVRFDGRPVAARLIAIDYHTNLALIQTQAPVGAPAILSDKRSCAGHMVLAMGNSFGLRAAPSLGFCAGLRGDGLMQFSAPITSGTIGGGIFDMNGQLLGVIAAGMGDEQRIALAVPAYSLRSIIDFLLLSGDRHAGFLGITSADIEIVPPLQINAPIQKARMAGGGGQTVIERGIVITRVIPGSPASKAGLIPGDLILDYNGTPYQSAAELARAVHQSHPGSSNTMEIVRQNRFLDVTFTVGQKQLDETWTPTVPSRGATLGSDRVIDSLTDALTTLKDQLLKLESRVNTLRR